MLRAAVGEKWAEEETLLCPYARGRAGIYTCTYMHTVINTRRNSMVGGNMRLKEGRTLSRAIWIAVSKLPEMGSCQSSRLPKSKVGMRSRLLLAVCTWQRSFQLQGTENPTETTRGVCWLMWPELAFSSSFLISHVSSILSRFPTIPMMAAVGSPESVPCSEKGKPVSCKSQQTSWGSLWWDWFRSLVHLQSPGMPCSNWLRLGMWALPRAGHWGRDSGYSDWLKPWNWEWS